MRPLVFYCRWQRARLRLQGRDERFVWGELALEDGRLEPFRYELATRRLERGAGASRVALWLDDRGVVIPS